jgi:hypothetical protein
VNSLSQLNLTFSTMDVVYVVVVSWRQCSKYQTSTFLHEAME